MAPRPPPVRPRSGAETPNAPAASTAARPAAAPAVARARAADAPDASKDPTKRGAQTLKQGSAPGGPPSKIPRRYNRTLIFPDSVNPDGPGEGDAAGFSSTPALSELLGTPPPSDAAVAGDASDATQSSLKGANAGRYSYANPNGGRKKSTRMPAVEQPDAAATETFEALTLPEPLADPSPPPPPPKKKSKRPSRAPSSGSIAAVDAAFDTMLSDLDTGFASIVRKEDEEFAEGVEDERDSQDVRALFEQIAANYVRPVRDFVIDMDCGKPRREWIGICIPAIKLLRRSAEKMTMPELCAGLDAFTATLERCSAAAPAELSDPIMKEIREAYAPLIKLMPTAFSIDAERNRREPIIVQALLQQALGPDAVAVEKVYSAGLTTLDILFLASTEDIVQTTGLASETAGAIVERFRDYKRDIETVVPDAARTAEHQKLAQLVVALRQLNAEYDRAAKGWTDAAREEKKRLRQERTDTLLQINVVLARLGEVDRAVRLEKLSFSDKIRDLDGYLEEAKRRGVSLGSTGGT